MKVILSAFLSFTILLISIEEARRLYPDAMEDASKTDILHQKLSDISLEDESVLYGYKGATYTLKAKHAKAIRDKKTFFKEGVAIIEASIAAEPDNIELRFIRLSVQENAPKILKYRDKIEVDKKYILAHLADLEDGSLRNLIHKYIKDSKTFTDSEKSGL